MSAWHSIGKAALIVGVAVPLIYVVVGGAYTFNVEQNPQIKLEISLDGKTAVYEKKTPYKPAVPFIFQNPNGYERLTINKKVIDLTKDENSALRQKVEEIYSGIESILTGSN